MQYKITFELRQLGQYLPLSYQYELSAWIYRLIEDSNSDFADFLHNKGYTSGNKRFKLFCFSQLQISTYRILGDRIQINSPTISFDISFFVEQAAHEFIMGLFQEQSLRLGDRESQVDLVVEQIEAMPMPVFAAKTIRLRTASPLVIGRLVEHRGKRQQEYLAPNREDYSFYFLENLKNKYEAAYEQGLCPELPIEPTLRFRLLEGRIKRRGIRIKAFTPAETKVIGYEYAFEITAPKPMLKLGLLAGFGRQNALGFGAVRMIS